MNNLRDKIYLQITSGRGPAECCRVVAKVLEMVLKEAKILGLTAVVLDRVEGIQNRTLFSVTLSIEGDTSACNRLIDEWQGTVQWIAQSPYRIHHHRKNWFVGVQVFEMPKEKDFHPGAIRYETMRASGAGGQHVNKTETAVRATHITSGLSVTASDERSQLQNKKRATERLLCKLASWEVEQAMCLAQNQWSNHNSLERGNPVKVIRRPLI